MTTQRANNQTKTQPSRKTPTEVTFNIYMAKVLKDVHPSIGINGETQVQLDLIVKNIIRELTRRANGLLQQLSTKNTLTLREFQAATNFVFTPDIARHANEEGLRAETRYRNAERGKKGKPIQKSTQAGLSFSIPRVRTVISQYSDNKKIGDVATVYTTAVVEYLVAELLELSGNVAMRAKKQRITPYHLSHAIRDDREFSQLFRNYVFPIRDPRAFTYSDDVVETTT